MSPDPPPPQLISVLDTDLYKLTMQAAVLQHFPDAEVSYNFTNRSKKTKFSRRCVARFRLADLRLTREERAWLEGRCSYFPTGYLDFLEAFRFRPSEHVRIDQDDETGELTIVVHGEWVDTILYEVPLLMLLSEAYFVTDETRWDMRGQRENARRKGRKLFETGCKLSEFGTRRRRSYDTHRIVMEGLIQARDELPGSPGTLSGTSNVHLAHRFDLTPIGTVAHEWIMGTAALTGYPGSNGRAMEKWEQTYPGYQLSIALTDTFSTGPFWTDFAKDPQRAKNWTGIRQDSGDPFAFAEAATHAYIALGVDPSQKVIVFSDGLDPDKCIELLEHCQKLGIGCSFGVGTNLSNDFRIADPADRSAAAEAGDGEPREGDKSEALNIVIKLATIDGQPCVKISDELTKNTGRPDAVAAVKHVFGLDRIEANSRN